MGTNSASEDYARLPTSAVRVPEARQRSSIDTSSDGLRESIAKRGTKSVDLMAGFKES